MHQLYMFGVFVLNGIPNLIFFTAFLAMAGYLLKKIFESHKENTFVIIVSYIFFAFLFGVSIYALIFYKS